MGVTAGLVGVGGALAGLFGGNSMPTYNPTISPPAIASQAGSTAGNINNLASSALPTFNNTIYPWANQGFTLATNNAGTNPFESGALTAMNMGTSGATTAFNAGQNLYTPGFQTIQAGQSLVPFATAIEQQAFDPQSALYNQQVSNLTQQIDVANQQAGISMSPYGASVEANALGNFNLNWQNNLLNRMATGANAAGGLINTAAGATSTGAGVIGNAAQIAGTAPQSYLQAAGWPYNTYNTVAGNILSNTNAYTGVLQGGQNYATGPTVTDPISLIGAENQTNQQATQAYQAMLQEQNQQFLQNQLLGSALGRSLGGIGGLSGGGTGGNLWSGLNFGGGSSNSPLWAALLQSTGNGPYNPG